MTQGQSNKRRRRKEAEREGERESMRERREMEGTWSREEKNGGEGRGNWKKL